MIKETWNSFNTKTKLQWKDWESDYQVWNILGLFCNLIGLILDQNSVKGLRVIKDIKEIKFIEVWNELESKKCFQRQ